MSLKSSAEVILKRCMALKKYESFLVVTDKNLLKISRIILEQANYAKSKELVEIPVGKVNGEEPSQHVAEIMKKFDVVVIPTTKSLTHTKAREYACKAGTRIATLPGITESTFNRCIDIDYDKMCALNRQLKKIIDKASLIKITTQKGTDISFSIKDRDSFMDSGILTKKGISGNLPAGEVFIAPVEGTANGRIIVDASFAGIGKLKKPIEISVKDGYATDIKGTNASKISEWLVKLGKSARNIAEFGIGTNDKAKVIGSLLEDEKVKGTAHIALGNNLYFGGNVDVPFHADGVFQKPTIFADGKLLMDNGRFVFESKSQKSSTLKV